MKKLIISENPEVAATQMTEIFMDPEHSNEDFSVIPNALGLNPKFWARIVETMPELIARVPSEVKENKDFCDLIDHIKFFRYIPDKYLTIEELNQHEADPRAAIYAPGSPLEVNRHNHYIWYQFDGSSYWFNNPDSITVFDRMREYISYGVELCPELWTPELADLICRSEYFLICYEEIPEDLVKEEWKELYKLYKEKRAPILGGSSALNEEKLPEYWGSFKSTTEMEIALHLESVVERCKNPRGYAVQITFGNEDYAVDNSKYYKEIWAVVEPVISDSPELVKGFFDLYDVCISKYIPNELFNTEWIKHSKMLEEELSIYKLYKSRLSKADSPVAAEKARREMENCMQCIKDVITIYRDMTDDEAEALIKDIVAE